MADMLTKKEVNYISDLLAFEENACKKARLYARIMTNKKVAESFNRIADEHEKRFNNLLNLL